MNSTKIDDNPQPIWPLPVVEFTINYEDTDAGGVVYHANYLAYMERARGERLRQAKLPLSRIRAELGMVFVVTEASLLFRAPAVLDDVVGVTLAIKQLNFASMVCQQSVVRQQQVLVEGEIKLATVDLEKMKPMRMPRQITEIFSMHLIAPEPLVN